MKIYTRTGDSGQTGLFGAGRVPKDDVRVAAYGDVDELNATIGAARSAPPHDLADDLLDSIQRDLFAIGGQLATPDPDKVREAIARAQLDDRRIDVFEHFIDAADEKLAPLRAFILPAGSEKATRFHLARTVCRRAERSVVTLGHTQEVPSIILVYLNRLSDVLFTLARLANQQSDIADVTW